MFSFVLELTHRARNIFPCLYVHPFINGSNMRKWEILKQRITILKYKFCKRFIFDFCSKNEELNIVAKDNNDYIFLIFYIKIFFFLINFNHLRIRIQVFRLECDRENYFTNINSFLRACNTV